MASKSPPESISGLPGKRTKEESDDGEKRQKLSFGFSKSKPGTTKPGLQIKLNNPTKPTAIKPLLKNSSVFNDDSDEEPQEMPPEARMRMRNIGRETPTSAGPNSFGKTKQGFCNAKKVFEKTLSADAETLSNNETGRK